MRPMIAIACGLACAACSTLGTAPGTPEGLPHGGVGPFRVLPGATLRESARTIESGMVADMHLFYAAAARLPEPDAGMPDAGVEDAGTEDAGTGDAGRIDAGPIDAGPRIPVPDWSAHEPRAIYRSTPRADGAQRWDAGDEVLAAGEAWEGGFVHDPWAVVLADGRTLLYYAAEGGIGVAEASSVGGAFTRAPGGPVVAIPGARRPSVVRTDGMEQARRMLMYLEVEGAIRVLASDDGLAWSPLAELALPPLPPRDDRDSTEVAIGSPGALAARTPAGRAVLRLYYESRRADGQVLLSVAGSFDGVTFETCPDQPPDGGACTARIPIVDATDTTMPAPRQLDERITLLEVIVPARMMRQDLRTGIAPAGAELPGTAPASP